MNKRSRIFIAGHRGLVGSALVRRGEIHGCESLLVRTRDQLDLTDQQAVETFFSEERPEYVVLAAARVGGILANSTYPADFIRDNLLIQTLVIDAAFRYGTKRLLFLGSSCIYPRDAPQPLKEEYLLTGPLEETNDAYAIAKIAGIEMCEAYFRQHRFETICVMPTNLYGPNDNFDLQTSHVLPALIRKFHEARVDGHSAVTLWGTGTPRREFIHVDDLADACWFLMRQPLSALTAAAPNRMFNVGAGNDLTISELAALVQEVVGSRCEIQFDSSMPDGTPRKLLDITRLQSLGWTPSIPLREGIRRTYDWFRSSMFEGASADASRVTGVS